MDLSRQSRRASDSMTRSAARVSAFAFALFLAAGCNPNSIGRPCTAPQNMPSGVQIASPALECPSRLCLIEASTTGLGGTSDGGSATARATCTAGCSNNGDCEAETKEYCASGFMCAVATDVGNFCCRKLCICADDLAEGFNKTTNPTTGKVQIITPTSCDPAQNPDIVNECANVKK